MNKLEVKVTGPSDEELRRLFDMVPQIERYKIGDKVIRGATTVLLKRVKALTPKSSETGTAAKRSASQAAKADFAFPLWKAMSVVIRKYSRYTAGIVGPSRPKGDKVHFNTSPKGRRVFYWGKDAGHIASQVRNWIVQAFDETKQQQLSVMKAKLKMLIDEMFRKK